MAEDKYMFVKFVGDYSRGDDKIALNKHGLIRLSAGFFKVANLDSFKYAVLFYDPHGKAVAFKFTKQPEKGVFKLTKERGTAATISALSFMKAFNLNLRTYHGRYNWEKLALPDIGEVYIIKLDKK